jgi:hypothetical protein
MCSAYLIKIPETVEIRLRTTMANSVFLDFKFSLIKASAQRTSQETSLDTKKTYIAAFTAGSLKN